MTWERMSTSRYRLDEYSRMIFGTIIMYMRNEYVMGANSLAVDEDDESYNVIRSTTEHYRGLLTVCDHLLNRIGQSFDTSKLMTASLEYRMACNLAGGRQLARRHIEEALATYGPMASDSIWDRITCTGSHHMAGQTGPQTIEQGDGDGGGGACDTHDEHERRGGQTPHTPDSRGAAGGDPVRTTDDTPGVSGTDT